MTIAVEEPGHLQHVDRREVGVVAAASSAAYVVGCVGGTDVASVAGRSVGRRDQPEHADGSDGGRENDSG